LDCGARKAKRVESMTGSDPGDPDDPSEPGKPSAPTKLNEPRRPVRAERVGTRKQDWIASQLRRVYDEALQEDIPADMLALLSRLDDTPGRGTDD